MKKQNTKTKAAKIKPLTKEEAKAVLSIRGGADIASNMLAGVLRGIQRRGLPVSDFKGGFGKTKGALFEITTVKGQYAATACLPYFGAIATAAGIKAANKTLARK